VIDLSDLKEKKQQTLTNAIANAGMRVR